MLLTLSSLQRSKHYNCIIQKLHLIQEEMLCLVFSIWLLTTKSESTNEARNSQWRNNENHQYFPRLFLFLNHISGFLLNSHIQIAASSEQAGILKNIFPYFSSKFSFVFVLFNQAYGQFLFMIFFCRVQIELLTGLSPKRKTIRQQNSFPYNWNINNFPGPLLNTLAMKQFKEHI